MAIQPVRVVGESMWPTYKEGVTLLFDTSESLVPTEGDVVLAVHPFRSDLHIIKRVVRVETEQYFLVGDNPDPTGSEDSHNFGKVPRSLIVGVLLER